MPIRDGKYQEPTNADRAEWARQAVDKFAWIVDSKPTCPIAEVEEYAGDLVVDILHMLGQQAGIADLEQWLTDRHACYLEEVAEAEAAS